MTMHFHSPMLAGAAFTLMHKDRTFTVREWGMPPRVRMLTASAGRMNALADLDSVEGLEVTPRADGKAGLNLLSHTDGGTYSARMRDGSEAQLTVEPRQQKRGFASGVHYWLPTGLDGRFIFEPGQRHRKIYVSGAPSALTVAMIAAEAGVATSTVTASWLLARPVYGGSPEKAVAMSVFETLFAALYGEGKDSRSDWFLFERGYTYSRGNHWPGYIRGEDELHPMLFGAWGSGPRPFFSSGFEWIGLGPRYMAIRDLEFPIFHPRHGYGVIAEGCRISGDKESQFRDLYMVTWKDTILRNVAKLTPGGNPVRTYWDGSQDRISGAFGGSAKHLMMSGVIVDMCGWAKGYDYNRSAAFPMPPSDRNHGLYLTFSCRDLTLRDTVISQNASCGTQIRCGGYYERLLALDNNLALAIHSRTDVGPINQFATLADSVVFGAAHKRVVSFQGALNQGLDVTGFQTTQVGNIVAHRANPDDQAEYTARTNYERPEWTGGAPYSSPERFYFNDTQVWEWREDANAQPRNENVEGLDFKTLQETTIHRYAGLKTGKPWDSIDAFIDWLEAQGDIAIAVRETIGWTKNRFGRPIPQRTAPADLIFLPDDRMDGFRWDNRRNWITETLPGTHVADTVNLAGNMVRFGTLTSNIAALTFGGGTLDVSSGRLTVGTVLDAAKVSIQASGQMILGASGAPLAIDAKAGRVVLAGAADKLHMTVEGTAQALLGPDAVVPVGSTLLLDGPRVMTGWDGMGTARLTVCGRLEFGSGATVEVGDALYKQRLVDPGSPILASDSGLTGSMSGFEERHRSSLNRVHLYDLSALPVVGEKLTVGYTEYVADDGDYNTMQTVTVAGILSRSLPQLARFRSGMVGNGLVEPTVTAEVILAMGSEVAIKGRDMLPAGTYDLTGAGVTVVNQGAILPAGAAVVGGRLQLTIS